MFETYDEKSRRALFFARYEASKLGSDIIEPEHVLLGLLREGEETMMELLDRFNVDLGDLRRQIEGDRVFVERVSSTQELPLAEETKKSFAYASHEAKSMLHEMVGPAHLLIALLRVEGSKVQRLLLDSGLDLVKARKELASIVQEKHKQKETPKASRAANEDHERYAVEHYKSLTLRFISQGEVLRRQFQYFLTIELVMAGVFNLRQDTGVGDQLEKWGPWVGLAVSLLWFVFGVQDLLSYYGARKQLHAFEAEIRVTGQVSPKFPGDGVMTLTAVIPLLLAVLWIVLPG